VLPAAVTGLPPWTAAAAAAAAPTRLLQLFLGAGELLRLCAMLLAVPAVMNLLLGSAEREGGTYAGWRPLTMKVCSLSGVTTTSLPVSTLPSSLQ
jgi:hypothetical protein